MTITPHGYPDWGRYIAQADVLHFTVTSETISATTGKGPFFVGYTPYLGAFLQAEVGRFQLQLAYYNDAALTTVLGIQVFSIAQDGFFDQAVPVLGPYVKITIVPDGASRTYSATFSQAAGLANHHAGIGFPPALISQTGTAIGAGATVDADATNTFAGMCHCAIEMGGLAFEAFVRVRDYLGAVTNIAYIARPVGTTGIIHPFLLMVPGQQARISVTNASGGASAFNAYLIARPLAPGE